MFAWFDALSLETQNDLWVLLIASLTNSACALVGCYLVLRRMSLLGDAIAHAVLPGLVIAFVLSGGVNTWAMFLGALVVGLLTGALTQGLHQRGDVPEDVSMGVVFTSLFALGVILIKKYAHRVDLDPDCVLYGLLEYAPFHLMELGPYELPEAIPRIGAVLAINFMFIVLFWKELLISSFDPAMARALGIRATLMHYALLALVALTTVASFEQVGSILVIAMLIVPGAAAHLLTDRMGRMIGLSVAIAIISAWAGFVLAVALNVNIAGSMVAAAGAIYLGAAMFGPRYGVVTAWAKSAANALRIVREDVLAILYRWEEAAGMPTREFARIAGLLGGRHRVAWAMTAAWWRGEIARSGGRWMLTERGRLKAASLVRSHRLWETYLAAELGLPSDHLHEPAMRMEHYIAPELESRLAAAVEHAAKDPHGRPIPNRSAAPSSSPEPENL